MAAVAPLKLANALVTQMVAGTDTILPGMIGTGTANDAVFLRGDGVWSNQLNLNATNGTIGEVLVLSTVTQNVTVLGSGNTVTFRNNAAITGRVGIYGNGSDYGLGLFVGSNVPNLFLNNFNRVLIGSLVDRGSSAPLQVYGSILVGTAAYGAVGSTSYQANRIAWGTDGTGYSLAFAKNVAGAVTDLIWMYDNGELRLGQSTTSHVRFGSVPYGVGMVAVTGYSATAMYANAGYNASMVALGFYDGATWTRRFDFPISTGVFQFSFTAAGAVGPVIRLENPAGAGSGSGEIQWSSNASLRAAIRSTVQGSPNGGDITFWTGQGTLTQKMQLDQNGNLGIGMSPGGKLDVSTNTNRGGFAARFSNANYGAQNLPANIQAGVFTYGAYPVGQSGYVAGDITTGLYSFVPTGGHGAGGVAAIFDRPDADTRMIHMGGAQVGDTVYAQKLIRTSTGALLYVLTTSGSIGIGANPRTALDVAGNIVTDWNDRIIGTQYSDGTSYFMGIRMYSGERRVDLFAMSGDTGSVTISVGTAGGMVEKMRANNTGIYIPHAVRIAPGFVSSLGSGAMDWAAVSYHSAIGAGATISSFTNSKQGEMKRIDVQGAGGITISVSGFVWAPGHPVWGTNRTLITIVDMGGTYWVGMTAPVN